MAIAGYARALPCAAPRFILCTKSDPNGSSWDVHNESGESFAGATYVSRILISLVRQFDRPDLVFVATADIHTVPLEGPNVVVILLENEWCRIPDYASRVLAVFTTYGTRLHWPKNPLTERSFDSVVAALQDARTEFARLPTRWRQFVSPASQANVLVIPLGYFRQHDVAAVKPIVTRGIDVYFGGSATSQDASPLRRLVETPKNRSRRLLLDTLRRMKDGAPELALEFDVTKGFWSVGDSEAARYSNLMMDTKICVVPRGTSLETYRYFEGLRYGCVVVTEALPPHWFYDGAPHIEIGSWLELPSLVEALRNDPKTLELLQEASLEWWERVCAEHSVAAYIKCALQRIEWRKLVAEIRRTASTTVVRRGEAATNGRRRNPR